MITGVHAVGLAVSDIDRTLAAFGAAAPLKRLDRDGPVLVRGPNVHLELTQATTHAARRPVNAAGLAHICFQARAMERLRPALEQGGVSFLSAPVDLGTGFLYAYGRDRDGLLLETEGAPFGPAEPAGWFGHMAFVTADLESLIGFYAGLTERARVGGMRLRGAAKYDAVTGLPNVDVRADWLPLGAFSLEFWQYLNPPTKAVEPAGGAPGWTHLVMESDDVAADLGRALELGGTLDEAPASTPEGERASFRDPDGNRVRLVRWSGEARRFSIAELPHPDILDRVKRARDAVAA